MTEQTNSPGEAIPASTSTDSLISEIEFLRAENEALKTNRGFGLIWEEQREEAIERELVTKIPVLKQIKSLNIDGAIPDLDNPHILIEGDNLHALTVLQATHKGKIDLILIDPPYNTGKEFRYNDKLVTKEDSFRHSAWLSFMHKRLSLAKSLLKDNGLIFMHIDDNELGYLIGLANKIFGENNFLTSLCWVQSATDIEEVSNEVDIPVVGTNLGDIRHAHEYILVYGASSKSSIQMLPEDSEKPIESRLTKNGNAASEILLKAGIRAEGKDRIIKGIVGGDSEPITILNKEGMIIKGGLLLNDTLISAELANPDMIKAYFRGEKVIDRKGQEIFEVFIKASGVPQTLKKREGKIPISVLSGYGDTSKWMKEVEKMIGIKLKLMYPKPYPMIAKLIQMGSTNPNALILDFFAGTGTTIQAISSLNYRDKGNRQGIIVTNNEGSICRDITLPRLKATFTGDWLNKEKHDPYPGSLRFYETAFISRNPSRDITRIRVAEHIAGILAIRENAHDITVKGDIVTLRNSKKTVIAWTDLLDTEGLPLYLKEYKQKEEADKEIVVYVGSWGLLGDSDLKQMQEKYPSWRFETLPDLFIEELNKAQVVSRRRKGKK